MNPEITLSDYESIGTMDTALSEHADEAFFELSPDGQKIAEKIFKCLTETDRENREIRRAMTVEKLCAVAEADFSEVAAVIETFRQEGRTFLMPPPEVPLSENTLIDISHESLIRKWERLKNWVEEEGQSSRTYRRLAEDALLHQQNKVGFWSDPELKDALEWRENFKPNETWAQLYKETGERQFKASFADSMRYLEESKINRDEEIAADKRQQDALKSFAAKLRWAFIGLLILFLASVGVAGYAFYLRADAVNLNEKLATEKYVSDVALEKLKESKQTLSVEKQEKDKAFEDLKLKTQELEAKQEELSQSLKKQKEATEKAENESKRADEQTKLAKLSELKTQKALEKQKQLSAEAEAAKNNAIERQKEAEIAQKEAEVARGRAVTALAEVKTMAERQETNRSGLVFIEQGEFRRALPEFRKLLARYENELEPMSEEVRNDGKWWALHNLGIVNSNLPAKDSPNRFRDAECSYKKALNVLQDKLVELNVRGEKLDVSQCPPNQSENSVQNIAPNIKQIEEINRSQVTTLRRLAQFYHEEAQNSADSKESQRLNTLAVENYYKILKILPQEFNYQKQVTYPAALYVELADALADLDDREKYAQVPELYKKAAQTYETEQQFDDQIEVLRKWSDFEIKQYRQRTAIDLLKELIKIQEEKLNLSPFDADIAENYNTIDKLYRAVLKPNENYGELSRMIADLDLKANKTQSFYVGLQEVENLANAYLKIGKCRRAEKVYLIANDNLDKSDPIYPRFLIKVGQFYRNTLHDNKNAEPYFAKFVEASKKIDAVKSAKISRENGRNPMGYREIEDLPAVWTTAGDFYFEIKNYEKAHELYEQAKAFSIFLQENFGESKVVVHGVEQAEIIVKTARLYEAQNKLEEAEAKYSEAADLVAKLVVPENSVNSFFQKAKVLIDQADFYERHGNKQKAQEISLKAETVIKANYSRTRPEMVLEVYVNKKLGDINRGNRQLAEHYYSRATYSMAKIRSALINKVNEETPYYSRDNKLTAKFYSDLAEIYEARISLSSSSEIADSLKKPAEQARKEAEKLKLEEEKSRCEENN
ncbi:MAG TPA: hypothetical protein VF721_21785 [Pyrinomonadaceae bacterium]|jgi:tetratricopeptide (TPR) repeat protein